MFCEAKNKTKNYEEKEICHEECDKIGTFLFLSNGDVEFLPIKQMSNNQKLKKTRLVLDPFQDGSKRKSIACRFN